MGEKHHDNIPSGNIDPQAHDIELTKKKATFPLQYAVAEEKIEYTADWIEVLNKLNTERTEERFDGGMYTYMDGHIVQYLFTVCVRLGLPNEVRYMAAHIYDKFSRIYTQMLRNFVCTNESNPEKRKVQWADVNCSLKRQVILRVCSSIQLASKEHSHEESLTADRVEEVLQALGSPYTLEAIKKSERRVFRVLDHQLPHSPIMYIECVIKIWDRRFANAKYSLDRIWSFMLVALDVIYVYRDEIYGKFQRFVEPQGDIESKYRYMRDWFHLSASVLTVSVWCAYKKKDGEESCIHFGSICGVSADSVWTFANVVRDVAKNTAAKESG